jgi:putative flippase GtrA
VFAYAVGMSVAFTLNIVFVFPNSPKSKIKQARDFALVNISFFPVVWAVSVLINNGLLASGMLKYTQEASHAVAVILPTFLTFLIYKLFAFKDSVDER